MKGEPGLQKASCEGLPAGGVAPRGRGQRGRAALTRVLAQLVHTGTEGRESGVASRRTRTLFLTS